MLALLLNLLLLQQAQASASWTALQTPSLCQPGVAGAVPPPLANGGHLLRASEDPPDRTPPQLGRLPLATFQKILDDTSVVEGERGSSTRLEFFKSSASLLARGELGALEAARRRIAELDRAAEALAIDVEVDLSGTAPPQRGSPAKPEEGTSATPVHWTEKRRVLSGDEAFFGERKTTGFVMSFDVEVAADSGIASPVLGTAVHGQTLHLHAARVDQGRRVLLRGLLDLSELTALDRFDPETPDLGVLQQPALDFVQIAFAGVVDSGGTLEVRVSGAPLSRPDWKLALKAIARAEEDPATKHGFLEVLDLSAIATEPAPLPAALPGAGLERILDFVPSARGPVAIPPSAIAAALDAPASGSGRLAAWWGSDLLVLRRGDAEARAEALALVAAGEAHRIAELRIEARHGRFSASFPACAGSPARLLAGRERTTLSGYRVEIAPQTWMAAPEVQRVFDGLAMDALVFPGSAECSLWVSKSAPATVVPRADAQIGKVQALSRGFRTERVRIRSGDPEREVASQSPQDAASESVILRCVAP